VFTLIDNASSLISAPPTKTVYFYGEYQQLFNQYPHREFDQGLPNIEDFDGKEPTLVIIDDLMQETNETVADMFIKGSHHRNIIVVFLAQNLFFRKASLREQCVSMPTTWFPLHGSVQESERGQSVCKSCQTDVSEDVPVCRRSI